MRPQLYKCFNVLDQRGSFVKIYENEKFQNFPKCDSIKQVFYTNSGRNVIRGIHIQTGPMMTNKLIKCVVGQITDVIVNLDKTSEKFGEIHEFVLTEDDNNLLHVPPLYGHGFKTDSDIAILFYMCDNSYRPEFDKGVRWNSIDYNWNIKNPIISNRDSQLPLICKYEC